MKPAGILCRAVFVGFLSIAIDAWSSESGGEALVRHSPQLNGTVDGSIHQLMPESVTLNGGTTVTGDLLVPGTPTVRLNGHPGYAGTVDGAGAATPSNYQVTLNGGASLRHVVRRSGAVPLPVVSAPPLPTGSRSVVINVVGQNPGSFATLRNLLLNGNVGTVAVPPGTYGDFTANGGSGFVLGVAGSAQPALYNFQHLTLNGQTSLQVVGPVILNVASGFNANGQMGTSAQPAWLTVNIYSGGLTLNGGCELDGYVNTPNGTVIINGNSLLVGGLACDRLIVNGGGVLRLRLAESNHAPVANDGMVSVDEDASAAVRLDASDPDQDALTYAIVNNPAHGVLAGAPPNLVYTPTPNYNGADSFTYKVRDGQTDSNVATVRIAIAPVNDAPTATDLSVMTDEDVPVGVELAGHDVDEDRLTFGIASPPQHGVLSGTGAHLSYNPGPNYSGTDSFTYVVSDGSVSSAPAVVSIAIHPVNDAPVALSGDFGVDEGSSVDIALHGSDLESSSLSYTIVGQPSHGTLSGTAPNLHYRPEPNFGGDDTFTFVVSDGELTSAPATITITVTDQNFPPIVANGSETTVEDRPVTLALQASDADYDPVTFVVVTPPTKGSLGPITTAPDGSAVVVYTPATDFNGSDSFTFKANDGLADSETATFSLAVAPVNDAPVAAAQSVETDEDHPVDITLTGSDVERDTLTYSVVTAPLHGTLGPITSTPDASANVSYTPAADFNGADQFTYKVNDGELDSALATIAVAVNPTNDAPVVSARMVATDEDIPVTITLSGMDIDSGNLTFAAVPPQHGSLGPIQPTGPTTATVIYTPAANYHGTDSFTFVANDGALDSLSASVSIDVHSVNDAPVATDQSIEEPQDTPINFTLATIDVEAAWIQEVSATLLADGISAIEHGGKISDRRAATAGSVVAADCASAGASPEHDRA